MKNIFIIFCSLMLSTIGFSQQPDNIKIKSFSFEGSGCPRGTAKAIVVPNEVDSVSYFQVVFSKFLAERGPGKSPRDSSKSCILTLSVTHEPGYKFTMDSVEFDGYGDIADGTDGSFAVSYKVPEVGSDSSNKTVKFQGPWSGDWSDGSSKMDFKDIYTSCRGAALFIIDTSIVLRNSREGISRMGVDIASGKLKQNLYAKWRKCD